MSSKKKRNAPYKANCQRCLEIVVGQDNDDTAAS